MVDPRGDAEPAAAGRKKGGPPATPLPRTVYSLSEEETFELGAAMARNFAGGELVLLEGDLGLGKTVFTRGIAAGLGIPIEDVSSPSFTIVQEYIGGRLPMFHVDLYRIDEDEGIETIGLEEILASPAVTVVEWGDRVPNYYASGAITVRLHDVGEGSRRIELSLPQGSEAPRRKADA